jgi:predicted phosphodiesterase
MIIIGDVHGKYQEYLNLISTEKSSIQVGDMDLFGYDDLKYIPDSHRFFKGNHDNYSISQDIHDLGDYGVFEEDGYSIGFIRGAYSIDRFERTAANEWYEQEQLTYPQMSAAVKLLTERKPQVILSHDGPDYIVRRFFEYDDLTKTRQALGVLTKLHLPKVWIFGHHHKFRDEMIDGCRFICLAELQKVDLKDLL